MPVSQPSALDAPFDVCVVGSGPAGLACAMRCHDLGLKTLLLEAGGEKPVPGRPDVLAAEILNPDAHDPTDITAAAALGGSSHWWGGRSVPYDLADFRYWPVSYTDMLPLWERAAEFLGSRSVTESPAPGAFAKLQTFDALRSETWGPQRNMSRRWGSRLKSADSPTTILGARVTGLIVEGDRIAGLKVHTAGAERTIRPGQVVLACGGLGSLRLMLLAQRDAPHLFGGPDGLLGRGYMGHMTGTIADLVPANVADVDAFRGKDLEGGVQARRRFRPSPALIEREQLANIAIWFDNGTMADPAHGSSIGSARYLAAAVLRLLMFRGGANAPLGPHIANFMKAPVSAVAGLFDAAYSLAYTQVTGKTPKIPLLHPVSAGVYRILYHSEQRPDSTTRVSLSSQTDSLGLPRLRIDFRFADEDIESVVRMHELLDEDLRAAGAGSIRLHADRAECVRRVKAAARDGYHQIGGAVMSPTPDKGIVDLTGRTHDLSNLWVAAGCVLPSGGQANPTLTIVALALNTADAIARTAKATTATPSLAAAKP